MSKIITQDDVNNEVKKYLENFKNGSSAINTIKDESSRNYYNGGEISFIFEQNVIEALWKLNPTANGLRVYYGSHPDGNPTLILIACELTRDAEKVTGVKNLIYSAEIAGGEWPTGLAKINSDKADEEFDVNDDNFRYNS